MGDMMLRRNVMGASDPNIIYLAHNLVCDGDDVYDTGFAPFSHDNASVDFKITLRLRSATYTTAQAVVMGCKYEGTLSGQQYPGIYIRFQNASYFEIGGYNYYKPTINSVVGKNLYIWRRSGTFYAQLEGSAQQTLSVRVAEFNQNIIFGAGQQTGGTYFRYSNCVIEYVRLEYI